MKILLVCGAGMSSGILMDKMEQYVKEKRIFAEITAVGIHRYQEICAGYDIILFGPQIAYKSGQAAAESGGIPVLAIPPRDYASGNARHIFELIEEAIKKRTSPSERK